MTTTAKRLSNRDGERPGTIAFSVTKPVRLDQLDDELTAEMGLKNRVGIVAEGDPASASDKEPLVLWVLSADLDANTFKKVVNAHEPEKETNVLADLKAKVAAGDDLTASEVNAAVKELLLRTI